MGVRLRDFVSVLERAQIVGNGELEISGLAYDSRKVAQGDLFVCISGYSTDGHIYAQEAIKKGASALVVERKLDNVGDVPLVIVDNSRRALALLSAKFFGYPADGFLNVAITGTNGKTTTSMLVESVLKAGGYNPGLIGTILAKIGKETYSTPNTTPESFELHKMFARMAGSGQDSLVMEVSSHALALDRVYKIPYDIAVFTNLTQDHLDFHKDMEDYFYAKSKLFTSLGTCDNRKHGPLAIINLDDHYAQKLIDLIKERVPIITYGNSERADVRCFDVKAGPNGLKFNVESRMGSGLVELPISGKFNVYNALAAVAVGMSLGMNFELIVESLKKVRIVPGRFQLVSRAGQDFTVIVDYAHTPDGLANLLDSARDITANQVSLVFGCGGDRDKGKRPIMGNIAAEKADWIYITTDNPRSEDPEAIVADILSGIPESKRKRVEIIYDRAKAIKKAIKGAMVGDTVVIAGKGHETYQKFSDHTAHFDDVEEANLAIEEMGGGRPGAVSRIKTVESFVYRRSIYSYSPRSVKQA